MKFIITLLVALSATLCWARAADLPPALSRRHPIHSPRRISPIRSPRAAAVPPRAAALPRLMLPPGADRYGGPPQRGSLPGTIATAAGAPPPPPPRAGVATPRSFELSIGSSSTLPIRSPPPPAPLPPGAPVSGRQMSFGGPPSDPLREVPPHFERPAPAGGVAAPLPSEPQQPPQLDRPLAAGSPRQRTLVTVGSGNQRPDTGAPQESRAPQRVSLPHTIATAAAAGAQPRAGVAGPFDRRRAPPTTLLSPTIHATAAAAAPPRHIGEFSRSGLPSGILSPTIAGAHPSRHHSTAPVDALFMPQRRSSRRKRHDPKELLKNFISNSKCDLAAVAEAVPLLNNHIELYFTLPVGKCRRMLKNEIRRNDDLRMQWNAHVIQKEKGQKPTKHSPFMQRLIKGKLFLAYPDTSEFGRLKETKRLLRALQLQVSGLKHSTAYRLQDTLATYIRRHSKSFAGHKSARKMSRRIWDGFTMHQDEDLWFNVIAMIFDVDIWLYGSQRGRPYIKYQANQLYQSRSVVKLYAGQHKYIPMIRA